jgi:nitroimidazol reductase NimA-like FMN-containing flavoprotein (pyridoxamine 5'-phosphate oxidase superfamily)
MLRQNPECCVQIESVAGISDWVSVIVWGKFEELKGHEANEAMRELIDNLSPQVEALESSRSPRDVTPGRIDKQPQVDIVYRIKIRESSGRFESSK